MDKIYNVFSRNARQRLFCCLAFLFLIASCRRQPDSLSLQWKNENAVAIRIPSSTNNIRVKLAGADGFMLGRLEQLSGGTVFTPLVPLTRGATYQVFAHSKLVGKIRIPALVKKRPNVVIYPQADIVPENLLKIYLQFTVPMQQGRAISFVRVMDRDGNRLERVFLDMQPELWDTTGRIITLWLDPGRIKRGLTLNAKEGNPLQQGKNYKLIVSGAWKSTNETAMGEDRSWYFTAGNRYEELAGPQSWTVSAPPANTRESLKIRTIHQLDHFLAAECIKITGPGDREVPGKLLAGPGNIFRFEPDTPWAPGTYQLTADPKLEDLAGNNLVRPFDRDLKRKYVKADFVRQFSVVGP